MADGEGLPRAPLPAWPHDEVGVELYDDHGRAVRLALAGDRLAIRTDGEVKLGEGQLRALELLLAAAWARLGDG